MDRLQFRTSPGVTPALRSKLMVSAAMASVVVMAACGPQAPSDESATSQAVEPQVLVQPPKPSSSPKPASTPEPTPTPTPEPTPLAPPEAAADTIQEPLRQVFVATAFQSVSEVGTHDFPAGAKVNLLEVDGEYYLIEYNGVAVKNHMSFFSETAITEEVATSEPAPVNPEDSTMAAGGETPATEAATPTPEPLGTPEPPSALSEEQMKIENISQQIRQLDDQIREARTEAAPEPSIERLKKQRDQLSEELTEYSKP